MRFFCIFLAFIFPIFLYGINYQVQFTGIRDPELQKLVGDSSDLKKLKDRPPYSLNALNYRAKNDLTKIVKALRSHGYYDAKVSFDIETENQVTVFVKITPGPRYVLEAYNIYQNTDIECAKINLKDLGVNLNAPITWKQIINAELDILTALAECGYPLADIDKRDVSVDMLDKNITVSEWIYNGPLARYGPISIMGLNTVKPEYILNKIPWEEGDIYSSVDLEKVQQKLIQTELFSSVLVTHAEELDPEGQLPLKMHVEEARHRSFNIGASYATVDGFGGVVGWVHRNFRGMGETLRIEADIAQASKVGFVSYTKPDFWIRDQNLFSEAAAVRENITAYLAITYRGQIRLDRQFNKYFYGSIGARGEYISIHDSIDNGKFFLLSPPVFLRFSTANSLLDPTKGFTISYKVTPYFNVRKEDDFFIKHTLLTKLYFPTFDSRLVFAFRILVGSIGFSPLTDIPFNKRFLGGSDDDLRGYRYRTVSPTDGMGNPTGGRSAIYATFEPRIMVTDKIGVVPFTDWGTVSTKVAPNVNEKWFKSVGIGIRYFTFFGPIRADLAFPLDRRRRDPGYRIYVSIGQTF